MALRPSELHALARKYALLDELRRRHDEEPPSELVPLAREFPGSLRELDRLPLEEIERRSVMIELALGGGPVEALLEYVSQYHALMRTALCIKRSLSGRRNVTSEEAARLAESATVELGVQCEVELVLEVVNPPGGRLNEVVLARMSRTYGIESSRLRALLFRESPTD